MARPARPGMTATEHDLAHAATGLRTAATAISKARGADAASASSAEKAWRTVSARWVQRQHAKLGCGKTMGAAKPKSVPMAGGLRQNVSEASYSATRMDRVESSGEPQGSVGHLAGVQPLEPVRPVGGQEIAKGGA